MVDAGGCTATPQHRIGFAAFFACHACWFEEAVVIFRILLRCKLAAHFYQSCHERKAMHADDYKTCHRYVCMQ